MAGELYVATEAFAATVDNEVVSVKKGELVRAGHPLLKARAGAFKLAARYRPEVETTTAAPGEKR